MILLECNNLKKYNIKKQRKINFFWGESGKQLFIATALLPVFYCTVN
jgi:hypothetical protein